MNISEHFQIETSTVAGLETRTNTLIPFRYVVVKLRCVVMVVGGVRGWGGGWIEWGINPNPEIEESCS